MADVLENKLSLATEPEAAVLMERFDPEYHMNERVRARIAARLNQTVREERTSERRTPRFPWKKALVAVAACAAIYLTLGFTVPGVADALYRVFHPDYRSDQYFATPPEQREPIPDIAESVARFAAKDVEARTELLGEYTNLTRYDEGYNELAHDSSHRVARGLPPYRAEDYAYLKDIRPEVREVYYDGSHLFVNVFLACDDPEAFLADRYGGTHRHSLEINTFGVTFLTIDGERRDTTWLPTRADESVTERNGQKGLWYTTSIGLDTPLPDGLCELTLLYYIYDCDVDDMASTGNVARVVHTVSFDTSAGNRYAGDTFEAAFSGSAPMTLFDVDENGEETAFRNRMVSFDGLRMRFAVRYLPSGLQIEGEIIETPRDWTEAERSSLDGFFLSAMVFDAECGGETFTVPYWEIRRDGGKWIFELPVFPSEYRDAGTIVLIPRIRYLSRFDYVIDNDDDPMQPIKGTTILELGAEPVEMPAHTRWTILDTPLSETRIEIPLPKDE